MRQVLLEAFRGAHRVLGGHGLLRYGPLRGAYRCFQRVLTFLFRSPASATSVPVARVTIEGRELLTHADDAVWRMHLSTGFKELFETALLKRHVSTAPGFPGHPIIGGGLHGKRRDSGGHRPTPARAAMVRAQEG